MTTIYQSIKWSSDISAAPKGETVVNKRTMLVKGKPADQEIPTFIPTFILALTKCGKVVRTYWISGNGRPLEARWSGLNHGEQPLLWAHWPNASDLMDELQNSKPNTDVLLAHAEEDA